MLQWHSRAPRSFRGWMCTNDSWTMVSSWVNRFVYEHAAVTASFRNMIVMLFNPKLAMSWRSTRKSFLVSLCFAEPVKPWCWRVAPRLTSEITLSVFASEVTDVVYKAR